MAATPRTVGVDGRNLALAHGTGVATYAGTLLHGIQRAGLRAELLVADPLLPRAARWLAAAWPGAARARPLPAEGTGPPRRAAPDLFRIAQVHVDLWRRLRPVRAAGSTPDIMHWTYPLPLHLVGRPNLYTVHDLIPLRHPELSGIDGPRLRRILAAIARRATHLVTVSEATRQDMIALLGLDPARITNTGQAVAVDGATPPGVPGLVPGAYFLHVGAVERRKNLRRLIAAWRASGTPHPLVLAGPDGWNGAADLADAPPGVVRLPWLDRPRLLGLIRDARALLMPSLAEGFGLPVAEAMALGTPVLTSAHGALAEIAGPAALLVDPMDTQALAEALRALDTDAALRARLAAAGPPQAAPFSPARYAERLRALYATIDAPAP